MRSLWCGAIAMMAAFSFNAHALEPVLTVQPNSMQVFYDHSVDSADDWDVPDAAFRAARLDNGSIFGNTRAHWTGNRSSRLGTGSTIDMNAIDHRASVDVFSGDDADWLDMSSYNQGAWVASLYRSNSWLTAFVNNDSYGFGFIYGQGSDELCPSHSYMKCWWNTIYSIVDKTTKDGSTWEDVKDAPNNTVAVLPYEYNPFDHDYPVGYFSPSNVWSGQDGYRYMFVRALPYKDQLKGNCLLRTTAPYDAASWRAWDGTGFNIRFVNPYSAEGQDPNFVPADHVCAPVSPGTGQYPLLAATVHSVVYDRGTGKYIGLSYYQKWKNYQMVGTYSVYYHTSSDKINWTEGQFLIDGYEMDGQGCIMTVNYPSFVPETALTDNFDEIATTSITHLYFTRINHTQGTCDQGPDRDMMRVQINIARQ